MKINGTFKGVTLKPVKDETGRIVDMQMFVELEDFNWSHGGVDELETLDIIIPKKGDDHA